RRLLAGPDRQRPVEADGRCQRARLVHHRSRGTTRLTSPASLQSGSGWVDATREWLVGAKGEYPIHRPYLLDPSGNPGDEGRDPGGHLAGKPEELLHAVPGEEEARHDTEERVSLGLVLAQEIHGELLRWPHTWVNASRRAQPIGGGLAPKSLCAHHRPPMATKSCAVSW